MPLNDYGDLQTAVEASLVNAEKHSCTRQRSKVMTAITLLGLTSTWSNTTGTLTLSAVARRQVYTDLL